MASDNTEPPAVRFTCKCLNIRISSSLPPSPPPEYLRDPVYIPIFVKDDAITVIHPQATVRMSTKPEPIPGSSRHSRFTSVTCLFCDLSLYRVHQTISLDVEGNESTLLPTEEWVEKEIMKSATGWIDVHRNSLTGESILEAESSSLFAGSFSLLLPSPPSPSMNTEDLEDRSESKNDLPEHPLEYLTGLRPLFLPPPYTSSHPIFLHLASIANQKSQELRAAAELKIVDFIKSVVTGVENEEKVLKGQVDILWKNYKQHLSPVQQEQNKARLNLRPGIRTKDSGISSSNGMVSPSTISSSVTIRNFVPQPISPAAPTTSTSLPRVSALSASIANSHFHHPKETEARQASLANEGGSNKSSSSTVSTPQTGSSTLVQPTQHTTTTVLEYRRNLDEHLNTQASYQYFLNLDEEMARHKRTLEAAGRKQEAPVANGQNAGPSQSTTTESNANVVSQAKTAEPTGGKNNETTPSRGRDKGKRRVTFVDVAQTVPAKQNAEEAQEEGINGVEDNQEMVFPWQVEDFDGMDPPDISVDTKQTSLLFMEQPSRPIRVRNARSQNNTAFEAFSSLRPASLPNPSHIRPIRSQPGVDSSSQNMLLPRIPSSVNNNKAKPIAPPQSQRSPLNEQEAEILKLVAADTPSHRGAWTPGSKAWESFIRRRDSRDDSSSEEDGDSSRTTRISIAKSAEANSRGFARGDDGDTISAVRFMPGSLPVNIVKPKVRGTLSLASYLPPSALSSASTTQQASGPSGKPTSSAAIHKAAYAERDRNRAMDPGALDFVPEEDEEDAEETNESQTSESASAGDKARKHALKILQARSELPEEGMWRSLA